MKLLSAKRLAEELSVTERHVRQMIAEGRWPVYRVGKTRLRLDSDEIKKLCRSEKNPVQEQCKTPGLELERT
jgi:excisionase family DNA binding protein